MSLGVSIYCTKHRRHDLDSCETCDQETANPTYYRGLRVSVYVDKNWLTNDGEGKEKDGWAELEDQIKAKLKSLGGDGVKLVFEEWEGSADFASDSELKAIGRVK